jgi:hypothetical protein
MTLTVNVIESENLDTVTIKGDPNVNGKLNSVIGPSGAKASYEWLRADEPDGDFIIVAYTDHTTDSSEYHLTEEDKGKYIKVRAIGSGSYQGKIESDPFEIGPSETNWISASGYDDLSNVYNPWAWIKSGIRDVDSAYTYDDNDYTVFYSENDYVYYTFYDNILDDNAIVTGIKVRIKAIRWDHNGYASFDVTVFKDSYDGTTYNTGELSGDPYYTYDNSDNLWGFDSWTGKEINEELKIKIEKDRWRRDAGLDHLQVKVHYKLPEIE